jgi:hypothetical protein
MAKNEARLKPMLGRYPITDFYCIDENRKLWIGKVAYPTNIPEGMENSLFVFSRSYDRINNTVDQMLEEFEIPENTTFMDERTKKREPMFSKTILLIPKEKILFAYFPACDIIIPTGDFGRNARRRPIQ